MKVHLLHLLRLRAPRPRLSIKSRLSARIDVQRRPELVAHVRQEARLHLVGAVKPLRLLVQLGVQRHHAAVRVLQLSRSAAKGHLPRPAARPLPAAVPGSPRRRSSKDVDRRRLRDPVGQFVRAASRRQAAARPSRRPSSNSVTVPPRLAPTGCRKSSISRLGADDPQPHPRLRPVRAAQDLLQVRDPRPLVLDPHFSAIAPSVPISGVDELDGAARSVVESVPRNFRHGRGHPRLVVWDRTRASPRSSALPGAPLQRPLRVRIAIRCQFRAHTTVGPPPYNDYRRVIPPSPVGPVIDHPRKSAPGSRSWANP